MAPKLSMSSSEKAEEPDYVAAFLERVSRRDPAAAEQLREDAAWVAAQPPFQMPPAEEDQDDEHEARAAALAAAEAAANWSRLVGNLYTAHEQNEQRARLIRGGFAGRNVEAAHLAMMEVHAEHMARRSAELGQCDLCKKQAELTKKTNAKGTITVYWCETCCENTLDTPSDSDSEPFISLSHIFLLFILGK